MDNEPIVAAINHSQSEIEFFVEIDDATEEIVLGFKEPVNNMTLATNEAENFAEQLLDAVKEIRDAKMYD